MLETSEAEEGEHLGHTSETQRRGYARVVVQGAKNVRIGGSITQLGRGEGYLQQSNDAHLVSGEKDQGRFDDETNFDAGFYKVQVTPTQDSAQGEAHSQEDQPEDHLGVLSAAKVLADAAIKNVHAYTRRRAISTGSGGISTASRLFSTAEESVSTVGALMPISTAGMVQEVNISIPSPVVVKDKGKGKMEESKDEQTKRTKLQQKQDRLGHEAAVRLQEELDEKERQRMARVHEATQSFTEKEWENIRARVKADEELTQRLQAEERNKYSEVDQAKMLIDLINQRKKYFVAQKAEAKRNKPMTQAQQRNYMTNYIKHMGSHTLQQLRGYSFDEIKELFETTMKRVNTFVPMDTKVRGRASELVAGSSQATITDSAEVGSSKRAAEAELDHEGSKRQKTNEASGSVQEQPDEEEKELSQEDLHQWMRGGDEVEPTNEESSDSDDEDEVAEIFRIDTNDNFENTNRDHEEREYEMEHEDEERCESFNDTTRNAPVCNIRRFEMIKYSFGEDEEYVAIKEHEYDDLTSTNEDACRTYQEIFRRMDEGWMVTRAE
ncbi:hypothetical protein Tco_0308975 [Tanacetum coccineum]